MKGEPIPARLIQSSGTSQFAIFPQQSDVGPQDAYDPSTEQSSDICANLEAVRIVWQGRSATLQICIPFGYRWVSSGRAVFGPGVGEWSAIGSATLIESQSNASGNPMLGPRCEYSIDVSNDYPTLWLPIGFHQGHSKEYLGMFGKLSGRMLHVSIEGAGITIYNSFGSLELEPGLYLQLISFGSESADWARARQILRAVRYDRV